MNYGEAIGHLQRFDRIVSDCAAYSAERSALVPACEGHGMEPTTPCVILLQERRPSHTGATTWPWWLAISKICQ